ncbi:penicillin-binding transpeptidase domain-containing protein [Streptomyces sp. ACA25]|uniref:penicillin-binding transpeptidase domain-containing protein n=1 Tax=Streptomyces sp. ACA25 TaxID=3022596 RepID=UPI002308117F|nr:penicillin-binding transpeptidase domain-containing protein [Streptomyces sp. ACA25]MDB1089481.1 penicillin-binding transpeptidase domain-containing protein [Streptomyces sp. ACA25]
MGLGETAVRKVLVITGAVLLAVAAGVLFWLLRGDGEDEDTARAKAQEFLDAWTPEGEAAAARHTDDPEAAQSLLESVNRNLAPESRSFQDLGEPEPVPGSDEVTIGFTTVYELGDGLGEWRFDSTATLIATDDADSPWTVRWDPALLHPGLEEGQTLLRTVHHPERAAILAADGSELAATGRVWSISLWPALLEDAEQVYGTIGAMDVGVDLEALAERVEEADPDQAVPVITVRDAVYEEHREELSADAGIRLEESSRPLAHHARSVIGGVDADTGEGTSGLQARYDEQLAGTPDASVVIADRDTAEAVETLVEGEGGADGTPVVTTIDVRVQQAAEEALEDLDQGGSIVAVQPSTGHILALADHPVGHARSAEGRYAPGSGFKVVTTAALLEQGLSSDEVLGCPKYAEVNGQQFHNQDEFELGPDTTLHEVFIRSCNTAYIENRNLFDDDTLHRTAESFGIGGDWDTGAAAFSGSVPVADGANDLAASLIGQARLETSPLVMAGAMATVSAGEFHPPVLVPGEAREPSAAAPSLSEHTLGQLRTMMRATVTEGTASALRDVPGSPHAKTGTAEFAADEEGELSTHAWMVGFLGDDDLAFAVLLEDGGSGGSHAGPVAAAFLRGLG